MNYGELYGHKGVTIPVEARAGMYCVCVCVCVCARACVRVCVCMCTCVRAWVITTIQNKYHGAYAIRLVHPVHVHVCTCTLYACITGDGSTCTLCIHGGSKISRDGRSLCRQGNSCYTLCQLL